MTNQTESLDRIVLVDKPEGWTSHDVVARCRRVFSTRRIGHAGTLDPMATGLLILGINRGTKLLTYLVGLGKEYSATIRLGQSTVTDDREGEIVESADQKTIGSVTDEAIRGVIRGFVGSIEQVPSAVSAIKVNGVRSYARVRSGETVTLAARPITIERFDVVAIHRESSWIDVDVVVACSSGTYVRALARDVGATLEVGGHLVALRRQRVGPCTVEDATPLDRLIERSDDGDSDGIEAFPWQRTISLAAMARGVGPTVTLPWESVADVLNGKRIRMPDADGTWAALSPNGVLVAMMHTADGITKSSTVFPQQLGAVAASGLAPADAEVRADD